ncbi:MAG: PspC domain-containing protein, partial [Acidimicrobiia bacterium]
MVRPQEGRVVAGVALAVADRLGMSPGAVRLIWLVLSFFGGFGVLLYIAGWLLIPEEGTTDSIAEDAMSRLGDATTWIGIGLIVIAGVTLITMLGWVRTDLAWAVALLAVGVLLYQGRLGTIFESAAKRDPGTDVLDPAADQPEVDASEPPDVEAAMEGGADDPGEPAGRVERPVPRRRREKSILGRLTMGTVFVVLGLMAILDTSDLIRPAFSHYMAVAVGIIGIGLLVGSVLGRSRGLIFAGIVLIPIMLASSVVTARFEGGWGDPVFRPATLREVDNHYTLTGGDMEIDLRRIDLGGDVVEIEGDLGFGRLLVILPEGVGLDLTAHVGFGDLIVFGDHSGGVDVDRNIRVDGEGVFVLDLDVG